MATQYATALLFQPLLEFLVSENAACALVFLKLPQLRFVHRAGERPASSGNGANQ